MNNRFNALKSIRTKLNWIMMFSVSVAMGISFLATISTMAIHSGRDIENQLGSLADIIAINSLHAVSSGDQAAAMQNLASLSGHKELLYAEILESSGRKFVRLQGEAQQSLVSHLIPSKFEKITIERPLLLEGNDIGLLRIVVDASSMWEDVLFAILVVFLGFNVAALVALVVIRKSSKLIVNPITDLAKIVNEVSLFGNYSLRVGKTTNDELGNLSMQFNQMMEQIESRDEKLQESREALVQSQEAVFLLDEKGYIRYVNPAFTDYFGYSPEEAHGKKLKFLFKTPEHVDASLTGKYASFQTSAYKREVVCKRKSGDLITVLLNVGPLNHKDGSLRGYVGAMIDISDRKKSEEMVWRQANFDHLTDLPNRRNFQERLEQEVKIAKRSGGSFALLFLDLDRFKEVNDTLGHDAGDVLLKEAGQRLSDCVRETDVVARLGGDEFAIILGQQKEPNSVEWVAEKILTKISEAFNIEGELAYVSISIGVVFYPQDADNAEELLKHADQAMYAAKRQGRDCVSYFTRELQLAAMERMVIANDLRHALPMKQFQVFYQPIVELRTGSMYKAEALIRWIQPDRGFISPAEFIPVAEEIGLIVEIGNWVFKQAVDQVKIWRGSIHPDFQISVNKSPVQFRNTENQDDHWPGYLSNQGLPGNCVSVEITEGLLMEASDFITHKLLDFRDAGMQVSLDDFGTGYSALSYLNKFDIDYLKIDKIFIQNIDTNPYDLSLCEAIIMMAHKLGIKVIAEGVETAEQLELLLAAGCDYGQGYFFSKPVAAGDFEKLVLSDRSNWTPRKIPA